jgi:hypothetical protein
MPATPAIMAISQLTGAGISAYGTYSQGREANTAQSYNASVLEQNASTERAIAAREVDIIKKNAVLNEYRSRKALATTTGEQVAGYARRGVSVGTGSPLDVMADSIANAELEIAIGNWNAENEIATTTYNAEVGARNKESEARFRRLYGKSAATNANYSAVGTLLTAGTTAYSQLSKEKFGKEKIGQ